MTPGTEEAADRADWEAFQQLHTLTDHWWWRPGWRPNRRYLTWYILYHHEPALTGLVNRCHQHLAVAYLDLAPPAVELHMTVQGVGFADEVTAQQAEAIVDAARDTCRDIAAFPLTIGPAAAYSGGVFLRATPWARVGALRARLRDAVGAVLGRDSVPDEPARFKPHISIAYCHDTVPASDLIQRVDHLRRRLPPIQLTVTSVSLIELRREARTYQWNVLDDVSLIDPAAANSIR